MMLVSSAHLSRTAQHNFHLSTFIRLDQYLKPPISHQNGNGDDNMQIDEGGAPIAYDV